MEFQLNSFKERKGITDQEFREYDQKVREERLRLKQIKRFRITLGGNFSDFEDENKAFNYLKNKIQKFGYASIHMIGIKI